MLFLNTILFYYNVGSNIKIPLDPIYLTCTAHIPDTLNSFYINLIKSEDIIPIPSLNISPFLFLMSYATYIL